MAERKRRIRKIGSVVFECAWPGLWISVCKRLVLSRMMQGTTEESWSIFRTKDAAPTRFGVEPAEWDPNWYMFELWDDFWGSGVFLLGKEVDAAMADLEKRAPCELCGSTAYNGREIEDYYILASEDAQEHRLEPFVRESALRFARGARTTKVHRCRRCVLLKAKEGVTV